MIPASKMLFTTKSTSLERWKNTDQDLFISALLMNPFIRDKCFAGDQIKLSRVGLYKCVAEQTLRVMTGAEFHSALMDYLNDSADFLRGYMQVDFIKEFYEQQVRQE
jgi:hypothetical protein